MITEAATIHTPSPSPSRWPWILATATTAWWLALFLWPPLHEAFYIWARGDPFLDLRQSLACADTAHLGLDPFVIHHSAPAAGVHLYSTWWLLTGPAGLTLADSDWLGFSLLAATLLLAVLSAAPATARETLFAFLVLASPGWMLAVLRANNDLVIFALLSLALLLFRAAGRRSRMLGATVVGVAAVLKYIPLGALALPLAGAARPWRQRFVEVALGLAIFALGWPSLVAGLAAARIHLVKTAGWDAYGSLVLPRNFGWEPPLAVHLLALLAAVLLGAFLLRRSVWPALPPGSSHEARELGLVLSAVILGGFFAVGASFIYKLIFTWWLLPWLWRDAPARIGPAATRLLMAALLLQHWGWGVASVLSGLPGMPNLVIWTAQELFAWALFILFAGLATRCLWARLRP